MTTTEIDIKPGTDPALCYIAGAIRAVAMDAGELSPDELRRRLVAISERALELGAPELEDADSVDDKTDVDAANDADDSEAIAAALIEKHGVEELMAGARRAGIRRFRDLLKLPALRASTDEERLEENLAKLHQVQAEFFRAVARCPPGRSPANYIDELSSDCAHKSNSVARNIKLREETEQAAARLREVVKHARRIADVVPLFPGDCLRKALRDLDAAEGHPLTDDADPERDDAPVDESPDWWRGHDAAASRTAEALERVALHGRNGGVFASGEIESAAITIETIRARAAATDGEQFRVLRGQLAAVLGMNAVCPSDLEGQLRRILELNGGSVG